MNRKRLCQLLRETYDFNKLKQFEDLIYYLSIIMFHTECDEQAYDLQIAIWFVQDQIKKIIT